MTSKNKTVNAEYQTLNVTTGKVEPKTEKQITGKKHESVSRKETSNQAAKAEITLAQAHNSLISLRNRTDLTKFDRCVHFATQAKSLAEMLEFGTFKVFEMATATFDGVKKQIVIGQVSDAKTVREIASLVSAG